MDARHRYVAQVVQLQLDLPLLTIEEFVAGDEQLRTLSDFFAADSILTRLFFFRASAVAQPANPAPTMRAWRSMTLSRLLRCAVARPGGTRGVKGGW